MTSTLAFAKRMEWPLAVVGIGLSILTGLAAQQTPPQPPATAAGRGAGGRGGNPIQGTNPPEQLAKDATGDARMVLDLAQKVEDATITGDVKFAETALSSDFSMVHGDQWTRGLKPLASDDKAGYVKRVAEKQYVVHDIAQTKLEVHGDVIITYGRYVSL